MPHSNHVGRLGEIQRVKQIRLRSTFLWAKNARPLRLESAASLKPKMHGSSALRYMQCTIASHQMVHRVYSRRSAPKAKITVTDSLVLPILKIIFSKSSCNRLLCPLGPNWIRFHSAISFSDPYLSHKFKLDSRICNLLDLLHLLSISWMLMGRTN